MSRKALIRIGIVVVIIGLMGFSDWSFAAESEGDGLKILGMGLNYLVSILGWIWVFFAKLAGTFLTNKWVYGEILGLDSLLWKYWNVMKNVANFGLGFYFVYVIFRGLINQGKEGITKKLKNMILWLLIAGIGIQASWFFVAAIIDVSTITLAAAGSFPSQVLSESPYVEKAMKDSLADYLGPSWEVEKGKQISLFPKNQDANSLLDTKTVNLVNIESFTGLVDTLMPNADDVSGPLYFIGFTILKTNVITSIDTSSDNGIKSTILNTIIQGGTTIVFAIEMLVLCVLALIRIVYLWMFIVLSPLAILVWCIEKSGVNLGNGGGFLSKFTSQISFKTFFINVFKPTIIVLGFGVALIFVALMNKVVLDYENRAFDMKGMTVNSVKEPGSNANGNEGDKTYTTILDNDFLHFTLTHSGKTLLEIVFSVLTVLMVYLIIDVAVKMGNGNDFLSKSVGRIQDGLGNLVKSAPVVPVPTHDNYGKEKWGGLSLSGLSDLSSKSTDGLKMDLEARVSEQTDDVLKMWGIRDMEDLTQEQKTKISNVGVSSGLKGLQLLDAKKDYINKNIEKSVGMTLALNALDGGFWRNEFTKWLNNTNESDVTDLDWRGMLSEWKKEPDASKRDLKKLFNNQRYATTYANYFGYKGIYPTFDSIKDLDISKKTETKTS